LFPARITAMSNPPRRARSNPARNAAPTPLGLARLKTCAPPRPATDAVASWEASSMTTSASMSDDAPPRSLASRMRRTTRPIFGASSRAGTIAMTRLPLYILINHAEHDTVRIVAVPCERLGPSKGTDLPTENDARTHRTTAIPQVDGHIDTPTLPDELDYPRRAGGRERHVSPTSPPPPSRRNRWSRRTRQSWPPPGKRLA